MYLRLGGIGNTGEGSMDDMTRTGVTLFEPSSSRLMKRSRIPGNGAQVPSCMVDGCSSDLSKCRDYHRRHKVCELHSKTAKVTICGQERRFCQQCSRFHSLVEFDDKKRSCRKRLDGHNRRRRKPQPATMKLNEGRFVYGNQGSRYLPFGNQLVSSSNDIVSSSWLGTIKPENNAAICGSNSQFEFGDRRKSTLLLQGSLVCDYKEKQQANCCSIPIGLLPKSEPFLNIGSSNNGNVHKLLGNGSNRFFDSHCALSLLSTPVEPVEINNNNNNNNNLSSMVQSNLMPPAAAAHFLHSDGLGFEISDPIHSGLVSDSSSDANIRCYSTFHDGPDGSSSIDLFRF